MTVPSQRLQAGGRLKGLSREKTLSVLPGGAWYRAPEGEGWGRQVIQTVRIDKNLAPRFVWFDILITGNRFVTFFAQVHSRSGERRHVFSSLCECQTRIVLPLNGLNVKTGDRLAIGIERKTEPSTRFCLGPIAFRATEPPVLTQPLLPKGPLVDAMGQSTLHSWPGKKANVPALVRHLKAKLQAAPRQRWPSSFSRWGGWKARRVKSTGFFRTHHDGRRWWLVDPDGYLFWSCGIDCVHGSISYESCIENSRMDLRPIHAALPNVMGPLGRCYRLNPWHSKEFREFNYLEANFIQAFGPEHGYDRWITVAHAELRRMGFNTAGDWSDEYAARREGTPYTRPLELWFQFPTTPMVGPNLPDVFHPNLAADARAFAEKSLRETRDDPGLLGYFLHNEPPWGFDEGGIVVPLLRQTPECLARRVLADRLRVKYGSDRGFQQAWGNGVSLRQVEEGIWTGDFSSAALADLREFSSELLDRLFRALSAACRKVDPHHLNLGVRWWTFPPNWALKAMRHFDVVSFNYYLPKVDRVGYGREREPGVDALALGLKRPFMVGEWQFGALDGGLPSAGLRRVADQVERGKAFRVYQEHAAALPWCVGTHWFTMYDQSPLSSTASNAAGGDGFLDGTHSPHEPICTAARKTHERLYAIAGGTTRPYEVPVKHLFPSC